MAYGQARENNAHTYANHHTPVAPQPKPRTKLSQGITFIHSYITLYPSI